MLLQFIEKDFRLRTLDRHRQHCSLLEETHLRDHYSKLNGVNERSILMDLQYFNVCSGSLITDVMHDLLEGKVNISECSINTT